MLSNSGPPVLARREDPARTDELMQPMDPWKGGAELVLRSRNSIEQARGRSTADRHMPESAHVTAC